MKNWLREPLVHFILLGAGLFLAHDIWQRHITKADYTIHVSAAEIQRQASIFATENQRQPTDEDIQGLLFAHIEEQALMREAQRLGLDENDTIIRRRLAQKMRFMVQDNAPPALPSDAELKAWFDSRKARFDRPAKRGFSHIYLSPAQHDDVYKSADAIMTQVSDETWQSLGDPFIEQKTYTASAQTDISRKFGQNFAEKLFALPASSDWQGPIESAFGLHIIRLNETVPATPARFEDVRSDVAATWQEETARAENQKRLEALLKKYKVDVEDIAP